MEGNGQFVSSYESAVFLKTRCPILYEEINIFFERDESPFLHEPLFGCGTH